MLPKELVRGGGEGGWSFVRSKITYEVDCQWNQILCGNMISHETESLSELLRSMGLQPCKPTLLMWKSLVYLERTNNAVMLYFYQQY